MIYNELIQRGTSDFPIELYRLDSKHPDFEMAAHWHSDIELIRVLHGKFTVKLDANEYIARKGDIIFVNAETVHSGIPSKDCIYECIVMKFDMISIEDSACGLFIDNLLNHDIHIKEFHHLHDSFTDSINNLFETLYLQNSGYKFAVLSAIYKILSVIMSEKLYISTTSTLTANNKNLLTLKTVLSFIRENYDKPLTLDEIAKQAKMSPRYFCSFFKQMTRKTPIEYLIYYRIESASRKLMSTNLSITDIALSCGFNDLSYFIKIFKSIKGISPSGFRKQF